MKERVVKIYRGFLVLFPLLIFPHYSSNVSGQVANHVVINEVELNPPEDDRLSTTMEWIELYNPTFDRVDISGWAIFTRGDTVFIEHGTFLQPGSYYIVGNWLNNENEYVILRNSTGGEVDRMPILSDIEDDYRTWARFPNGRDTDSYKDWNFRASTGGSSNGRETTTITITPSRDTLDQGQSLTITGSISPPLSLVEIILAYTLPDGSIISRTMITSEAGSFMDTYTVDKEGQWSVKASWSGNEYYLSSESSLASFTVKQTFSTTYVALSLVMISIVGLLFFMKTRRR